MTKHQEDNNSFFFSHGKNRGFRVEAESRGLLGLPLHTGPDIFDGEAAVAHDAHGGILGPMLHP